MPLFWHTADPHLELFSLAFALVIHWRGELVLLLIVGVGDGNPLVLLFHGTRTCTNNHGFMGAGSIQPPFVCACSLEWCGGVGRLCL